jgi:hypothetical protein
MTAMRKYWRGRAAGARDAQPPALAVWAGGQEAGGHEDTPSRCRYTCGKKLLVLVGQKSAVAIATRNVSGRRRWSKLSEWLRTVGPAPVRSC